MNKEQVKKLEFATAEVVAAVLLVGSLAWLIVKNHH